MAEVDSLTIELGAESSDAVEHIERLTESLRGLKDVAKGGAGLTATKNQLEKLNTALSNIANNTSTLDKLASLFRSVGSSSSGMNTAATALNNVAKAARSTKIDYSGLAPEIREVGTALGQISPSAQKSASAISRAGNALNALKVPKVAPSLEEAKNSLNALSDSLKRFDGSKASIKAVGDTLSSLPTSVQRAVQANAKLEASNNKTAKSFNLFGLNISKATAKFSAYTLVFRQIATVMSGWVKSANDYVEATNLFSVSMGEYYDEAVEYANLVNQKLKIDTTAWMDAQGTFMLMAKGFGVSNEQAYKLSKGLTELSYDIASLKNLKPEEAVTKLRSALAGELEPIRALGLSISQATLQEYALSKGIDEAVTSMTEQEKALLRSIKVMEDSMRIGYVGDFARTLESPANAMRVLKQQVTELGRALGSVLLPIITQLLPWIQAFVSLLTDAIKALAAFVGFTMPEWDTSDWQNTDFGFGDTEEAIEGATGAAKEFKRQLMGIDELTVLQEPAAGAGGAGGISDWASTLEIPEIWNEQMLAEINTKADELKGKLKDLLDEALGIAAAFASWKIASTLLPELGTLSKMLGSILIGVGVKLLVDSIQEILFGDGLTWESILNGLGGGAAIGGGLGLMLAKKLGLSWSKGMLKGALIGMSASLLLMSLASTIRQGMTWQSVLLGTAGGVGLGIALAKTLGLKWTTAGLAGGIIALGLTLVVDAIRDIIMGEGFGANAFQAAGGGAVMGGGLGLMLAKKLGLSLGAAGLPIIAIAAGISLAISGITAQIANGVNLAGAISTILGSALAGAGIGFLVGGPAGAAVGAAIGLTVGVVLEFVGIRAAGEAAYQATEDFQVMAGILERSADASERAAAAMDTLKAGVENLDTTMADFALASQLADEIYAINENANASNYELELMAVKVDVLNGLNIDGLRLSIDETTGRVKESKQAVDELIASLQEQAKMEAMMDLLVQSYKDQYTALADAERASRDYDAASQSLAQTAKELSETPWYDFQKRAELRAAQEKETEAVYAAQQALADSAKAYNEISDAIDIYTGQLVDMKTAGEGVANPAVESLNELQKKIEDTATTIYMDGQNIGSSLMQGVDESVKENEYKGLGYRIIEWIESVFGINSPSTVMIEMGGYLGEGLLIGISDTWESIKEFFSKSLDALWKNTSSFFTIEKWTQMLSSVPKAFTNTWNSVVQFWTKSLPQWWSQNVSPWFTAQKWKDTVKTIQTSITESFGEMVTKWKTNISSWWENNVKSWFSASKWKQLGSDALNGLVNGLSNFGNKLKNWGQNLLRKAENALDIDSPSKLFRDRIGINLGLGVAEGLRDSENEIVGSLLDITSDMEKQLSGIRYQVEMSEPPALPDHSNMLVRHSHDIASQQTSYIEAGTEDFEARMQSSNDQMTNIIMAAAQQIITAINSQSGDVYLDGAKVGSRTTQAQNRANRMYGRTLQNV